MSILSARAPARVVEAVPADVARRVDTGAQPRRPARATPTAAPRSSRPVLRWASWTTRHWPIILCLWMAVSAIAGFGAATLPGQLSGGGWYVSGSSSQLALQATQAGFVGRGATTLTLLTRDGRNTVGDPQFADRAQAAYAYVAGLPQLHVSSEFGWGAASPATRTPFIGDSGRTTVTMLGVDLSDGDARRELPGIQRDLDAHFAEQGLSASLVGPAAVWGEVNVLSERGLMRAEFLALPLLLGILLWIYRGWVAAGLSLLVAATCVTWTLGILSVVARFVDLSVFVQNATTMLGLGVAVDYSLFFISRFRDQAHAREGTVAALSVTMRTAGHTVASSGSTVLLAMGTLLLVDLSVIRSLGLGAVVVVAVAVVVNLVVLPALLAPLAGHVARPPGRHEPPRDLGRRWIAWTGHVMRRPVPAIVVAVTILAALATPAAQLSTFTPDARIIPSTSTVRAGWDDLRADFAPGAASPITVVLSADDQIGHLPDADLVVGLPNRLRELPGVSEVRSAMSVLDEAGAAAGPATLTASAQRALPGDLAAAVGHFLSADGRTMVVEVLTDAPPASATARDLVAVVRERAREFVGGQIGVVVGGETAEGIDSTRTIADGLPRVALTMLVVIYLVLLVAFRSVLLPLKAIGMNAASVAATYGVTVVVFQRGLGSGLLGFEVSGQLTNFVPILMLTLLFALSTDYEVFLLSRVREDWLATGDNEASVAQGLAKTAPLISGAAALMVAVFAAFAFASVLPVQELGLGMAVAILLDATLVRLVLVPASMRLLGPWNWWFPRAQMLARPGQLPPARHRAGPGRRSSPASVRGHPGRYGMET